MASIFGAVPQPKASVGTVALREDQSPSRSHAPRQELDAQQRIATPGETVPIVFCKRINDPVLGDTGGVWVSPPMLKQSCQYDFDDPAKNDGSFQTGAGEYLFGSIFAISQGQIVSTPAVGEVYIGKAGLKTLNTAVNPQVLKEYKDVAYMTSNPTFCPIPLSYVTCGTDNLSWLVGDVFNNGFDIKSRGTDVNYFGFWSLVRATGALSNTEINFAIEIIDAVSGSVLSTPTAFIIPQGDRWLTGGYDNTANWAYLTSLGNSGSYIIRLGKATIDYQANPLNPADTNEVTSVLIAGWQNTTGTSTPTAVDNRAFADITIFAVEGNVFDADLKQQQAYFYIDQGVQVDLYSGGLVSGSYTTGASNQFVDLVGYLFKTYANLQSSDANTIGAQIDMSNAEDIADFCSNYLLYCNGVISQNVNLIEYVSQTARLFLLSLVSTGGQYQLKPLLPITNLHALDLTALTPAATFSADEILPGTYKKDFIPAEERKPFFATMLYREVSEIAVSKQVSVQVSYPGTSLDAPIEQFDLTEVCTNQIHAAIVGAYELARRKHTTHTVSFSTALDTTGLIPTNIVKVDITRNNSKGDNTVYSEWYQITSITHNSDGVSNISAVHFPVTSSDVAQISYDIANVSFDLI